MPWGAGFVQNAIWPFYPKALTRLFCFTNAAVERPLGRAELRFCLTD